MLLGQGIDTGERAVRLPKYTVWSAFNFGTSIRPPPEDRYPVPEFIRDNRPDPLLELVIQGQLRSPYWAVCVQTTYRWEDEYGAKIRDGLMRGRYCFANVMVIGNSHGDEAGPYPVVPTTRKPDYIDGFFEITPKECNSVVRGKDIFLTRFVFRGKRGQPALRGYDIDGEEHFGFLDISLPDKTSRSIAIRSITGNLVETIKPGDYLLVRKSKNQTMKSCTLFEPLINFEPFDQAFIPQGKRRFLTQIPGDMGVRKGSIICDLPIVSTAYAGIEQDYYGVGYIPNLSDDAPYHYSKVKVIGAGSHAGMIVNAKIEYKGDTMITAKKL